MEVKARSYEAGSPGSPVIGASAMNPGVLTRPVLARAQSRRPSCSPDQEVIERSAQPYVAIKAQVTMQTLGTILPPLHGRVFDWLRERRTPAHGASVLEVRRHRHGPGPLVEVGVPVPARVNGDDLILSGLLPAGQYASLRYTGHPDGLLDATAFLLEWARQRHLTWDLSHDRDGERWGARLEIYETDPAAEPDMTKWTTQLAFRLSD